MRQEYLIGGIVVIALLVGAGLFLYGKSSSLGVVPGDTDGTPTTTTGTSTLPVAISFRVIDSGTQAANAKTRKNYAAYTADSFKKLWEIARGANAPALPSVDFSKEYVIGVFAGEKPSGGYSITVSSITDAGDTRTVAVTISKPGEGCVTTQALTSPYQIIIVPESIAFLERSDTEVTTPCE